MHSIPKKTYPSLFQILALAAFVVFALFAWQGSKGFNLWDEGYLWHGAQRVMEGDVPIRDFMAYDPGRYYWSAALMSILGDNGIMSLRAAVAVFQFLGLFAGLMLVVGSIKNKHKENFPFLILSALTFVIWMFPRHKLFDISLSIFLISALTLLIQLPSSRRYFFTGICVGLIAVFGRNHGVYGVAGSLGVMVWLSIKRTEDIGFMKGFALWSFGVILGYSPILLMSLVFPGFTFSFWESVRFLFEQKATNLSLPVPWPWTVNFTTMPLGEAIRGVLVGLFFMGTLGFGFLAVVWVLCRRFKELPVPPALVAAAFMALPYAHYAYSRADVGHLALGIFPLLVGCFVIFATKESKIKWLGMFALSGASFWVMYVFQPGWHCQANEQCVNVQVSGSTLHVSQETANNISLLRHLVAQYAPHGENFIVTPFWPGAYPLLGKKSPMWEVYALWPSSGELEEKEIERIRLAKPKFILILDSPLDGREELRFRNTHSLIYKYFIDNFEFVPTSINPVYKIYKEKE